MNSITMLKKGLRNTKMGGSGKNFIL